MNGVYLLLVVFVFFAIIIGTIAFVAYRRVLRRAKGIERGLKMVPLLIHLPPPSDDTEVGNRDTRDVLREKISQAQVLYDMIAGTAQAGFKSSFYGQRHIAFEIIASNGLIHYFTAVPITLVSTVEQAILTAYPGATVEEVEDHNIFNPQGKLTGTVGGELTLRHDAAYPIATYEQMERDPMEGLINALYKLQVGEGAAIQIMLRPAKPTWINHSKQVVAKKRKQKGSGMGFTAADLVKAAVKSPDQEHQENQQYQLSKLEETTMQAVEEKTRHAGYEVLVRVLVSSPTYDRSQLLLRSVTTAFALYEAPGSNGFQFLEGRDVQGLVTAFIFRFFPPEVSSNILNTMELATLFHLPDSQSTSSSQVERNRSKQVDGPANIPSTGLLMGYNFYRGTKKEIHLTPEDRRRHAYIVGQTGTGKSTILENLVVQDMLAGNGFAFIDPHGDAAEKLLTMVPKERAEDVVYFNPADTEHPLGINLFEYSDPMQKDFIVQESINMLYKLYDPGRTGMIGPRFEHWFRMGALTLMADPNGSSFIELPKVFTDTAYLKNKFKYLQDPTVIEFWTKEMGQTSDYHKSEMLGWFVSKFGAFQSNEMMRNIIGQTKSAFDIRDIMDNKKILIVNLSKGMVGELNSKLLGMIFVMRIQQAAMSRADMPEDQRADFSLYVDEFQNFSTDSFASILSEARKYRLNLIVANQFIGQLSEEIRDAVFGNVGTIMSYRTGPEDAEFLVKQFEPVFDVRDLVNIPNYNAVMRLMIGGLPSQPFSVTALPPLGQAHAEMGLAIKQLSAAKFGVPRATVEADIFARLQNQPRTVMPNPATAPAPTPQPTPPPIPASQPAPPVMPAPQAAPAPVLPPPAPPAPVQQPPTPTSTPPTASIPPLPAPVPAPPAPPAQKPEPSVIPVVPAKPADPSELSLDQLRRGGKAQSSADSPAVVVNPDHQRQQQSKATASGSIADVVGGKAAEAKPPTPPVALIEAHETDGKVDSGVDAEVATAPPALLIEAHEEDGRVDDSTAKKTNTAPVVRPLLIEAHEEDGKIDQPAPTPAPKPAQSPQPQVQAQPILKSKSDSRPSSQPASKPAPAAPPAPKSASSTQPQSQLQPQPQSHQSTSKPTSQGPKTMIATHRSHRLQESPQAAPEPATRKHKQAVVPEDQPPKQQPPVKPAPPANSNLYQRAAAPKQGQSAASTPVTDSVVPPTPKVVLPPPPAKPDPAPEAPSVTDRLAASINEELEHLVHPGQPVVQSAKSQPQPQIPPVRPVQSAVPTPSPQPAAGPKPMPSTPVEPIPAPVTPVESSKPESPTLATAKPSVELDTLNIDTNTSAVPPIAKPQLQVGEVMIDEEGNVIQG